MTRILDGVKVGDAVIVTSRKCGPDGALRKVRHIECVTKVFRHVLQTKHMTGIDITTGKAPWLWQATVMPATDADVADVLREIEERKRADEERRAKLEAERIADRRRERLLIDIREHLYLRVPEDVLARALAVLRGESEG